MMIVFGLIDPRSHQVAYVGWTAADYAAPEWVKFLHRTHQMQLRKGRRHEAWEALMQQPQLQAALLERTADPQAKDRWIRVLREAGHPLLNKR